MKYLNISIIIIFVVALSACNRDEIFEREQYKHIVSLLSNKTEGVFNIFEEELDLGEEPSVGYIAASCGGSLAITEPITIHLVKDLDLLNDYNYSIYENRADLYVKPLSPDRYSIDTLQIIIPANERNGKTQIRVNVNKLSPDSIYLIPFRIEQTNCEINPTKATLLYRVYMKNFYATNKTIVEYQHLGEMSVGGGMPQVTMMNKRVFPLSKNTVRMFAGNQPYNVALINTWSIKAEIGDGGKVTLSSWGNSNDRLQITQIDGDEYYPNVFMIEDLGYITYKTFLLCYKYTEPNGSSTIVKERLRLEYKPNLDKK